MKNKGRKYKRAVDALNKIHLNNSSDNCTKGYVLSTISRKYPNFFTAMIWDDVDEEWGICHCSYISTYMHKDGSWAI